MNRNPIGHFLFSPFPFFPPCCPFLGCLCSDWICTFNQQPPLMNWTDFTEEKHLFSSSFWVRFKFSIMGLIWLLDPDITVLLPCLLAVVNFAVNRRWRKVESVTGWGNLWHKKQYRHQDIHCFLGPGDAVEWLTGPFIYVRTTRLEFKRIQIWIVHSSVKIRPLIAPLYESHYVFWEFKFCNNFTLQNNDSFGSAYGKVDSNSAVFFDNIRAQIHLKSFDVC